MSGQLRHQYPAHSTIFEEGDQGDCAYIIEKGHVEIRAELRGETVVLASRGPGEIFGEMALIDRKPRSASASVTEDCEVLLISRDQLNAYLEQADPIMHMLLSVILERFRDTVNSLRGDSPCLGADPNISSNSNLEPDRRYGQAVDTIKLARELENAIERRQLELHYQPLISMSSDKVYGFESLLRWRHPERGLISPALFVPVAEQSNLIVPIGRWVFEEVCKALARFRDILSDRPGVVDQLAVGVNVSGREFSEPGFVEHISRALDQYRVEPERVTLEITETLLMEQPDVARATLEKCKDIGLRIAIDDFGTGYSSLSYLNRFPIDIIKIDQSFVGSMLKNEGSWKIVNAIVALAHGLRMRIVAEGIEQEEQHTALKDLGCSYAQGYLHSRPLPLDAACEFLEKRLMS